MELKVTMERWKRLLCLQLKSRRSGRNAESESKCQVKQFRLAHIQLTPSATRNAVVNSAQYALPSFRYQYEDSFTSIVVLAAIGNTKQGQAPILAGVYYALATALQVLPAAIQRKSLPGCISNLRSAGR